MNIDPIMDKEDQIYDSPFPYNLLDLRLDMYDSHFKKEYPFRVVELELYYQIVSYVYHFPKFVS